MSKSILEASQDSCSTNGALLIQRAQQDTKPSRPGKGNCNPSVSLFKLNLLFSICHALGLGSAASTQEATPGLRNDRKICSTARAAGDTPGLGLPSRVFDRHRITKHTDHIGAVMKDSSTVSRLRSKLKESAEVFGDHRHCISRFHISSRRIPHNREPPA